MGRLATHLATAVANVDNLPSTNQLEQVSLWDAFLPKSRSLLKKRLMEKEETPQKNSPQKVSACMQPQWCDIRRDYKGRKIVVAHKRPCYGNGPNAKGGGKGGTEDVKKGSNGNGNGNRGAKGGEKKDEAKAGGGGNGGKNGGEGGDEKKPHELTREEDETLKALKSEGNKPWKEIVAEMGKPRNVLKARWQVINPAKAGGDSGGKDGDGGGGVKRNGDDGARKKEERPAVAAAEETKDGEPKKLTKAEKRKAKQEEAKPAEKVKSTNGGGREKAASKGGSKSGSEARFTMGEWVTLQEDEIFSFGELQLLSELIAQYDLGRWQMVASRFFDKTGRRVHPDDVRDKFAALG